MREISALRDQHAALAGRVGIVETVVSGLTLSIDKKHEENRQSIHSLRNGQQAIVDLIHKLDIKFAKASGYAVGAGAVVALVVKLIDHIFPK